MYLALQICPTFFQQILRLLGQFQNVVGSDGAIRMRRCLSAQRIQTCFYICHRLTIGQIAEQIQRAGGKMQGALAARDNRAA